MFFLQNKFILCYGGALTIIFHGNGGDFTNENKRFIQVMCGGDGV